MQQLRQRVTATYHLGPMDMAETRAYIEHRLNTAGWGGDPAFSEDAFESIFEYSAGIPRKINGLCDRLLLMGCLENLHHFSSAEVEEVIRDVQQEFDMPDVLQAGPHDAELQIAEEGENKVGSLKNVNERLATLEASFTSLLTLLKQILSLAGVNKNLRKDKV
jgi:hypothetical protein